MLTMLWLIPTLPLASSLVLMLGHGHLRRRLAACLGVGSLLLAALLSLLIANAYLQQPGPPQAYVQTLWTWLAIGELHLQFRLYLDGLSLVMMLVITGVGALIHLYAAGYMWQDADFNRFFAYMNLFVAAMLILVLADNLVLLFFGWEGVGLCSYLLIGFWYRDPENGQAARKAFVMTRIGDTAMMIGLFLLFSKLGTLEIQPLLRAASATWAADSSLPLLVCILLLAGAAGKSAQLPLHNWLPDAMAGPTPVSALIHAATMVTAGVYLIARTHPLFLLSATAQALVATVGALTLLLAGFSALCQQDIKRVLAYSTISQIGYMFLALGVGAWSGAIFHLVTHAFFKALLFLSAGTVILHLHHRQALATMGGLRRRLPLTFAVFLVGCACLAALPLTSGFFSKEPILVSAWERHVLFWLAGAGGALLTGLYSFRLLFLVFFGSEKQPPTPLGIPRSVEWQMQLVLLGLAGLALFGGQIELPLGSVLPATASHAPLLLELIQSALPLLGVYLAFRIYIRQRPAAQVLTERPGGTDLAQFWQDGFGVDALYDRLFRFPFLWLARSNRNDLADLISRGTEAAADRLHRALRPSQTGLLRNYAGLMGAGIMVLLGIGILL